MQGKNNIIKSLFAQKKHWQKIAQKNPKLLKVGEDLFWLLTKKEEDFKELENKTINLIKNSRYVIKKEKQTENIFKKYCKFLERQENKRMNDCLIRWRYPKQLDK